MSVILQKTFVGKLHSEVIRLELMNACAKRGLKKQTLLMNALMWMSAKVAMRFVVKMLLASTWRDLTGALVWRAFIESHQTVPVLILMNVTLDSIFVDHDHIHSA